MKLLVVGHPFVIAYYQKKYAAMKQIEPNLQLRLLVPKLHRHPFGTFRCAVHPELSREEVIPLASAFSQSHMTYLHNPVRMGGTLRSFRPDMIHVEEEPQAFITVETLALRDSLCPQVPVTIFTWDNLHRRRGFPLNVLKSRLRAHSLRRAAGIICGNREAEHLLRVREGYEGFSTVLPQYGLDPSDHVPGDEPQWKQQLGLMGSVVVGYAGRLIPEKGIRLLLGALAELGQSPWKLLLVGSGPLEEEIREQWIPRFPGRIVHVRAVSLQEVPRYLRCLDVFVLASYAVANWKEQFGLSLAQAMMLGVPSVASSSGAIPEVAGPGALIFEEGNQKGLREALQALLGSASRRSELGARAREFALKHYTLAGVAAQYLAVFEEAQRLYASAGRAPAHQAAAAESSHTCHP